jgi:glycerol transport system ATP-binding protein
MVYQQFINYPSMTVFENIASPLQLRGEDHIRERVVALAKKLHIDMFLDRLPSSLSGGQQQRVALARALVKNAPLLLLDEPLVNLDYKLREELREELSNLFAQGQSTVVYATTEPLEALLLGGYTAVLDQGQLLQYGPTIEVFQRPNAIRVAQAFNDPPMNLLPAQAHPEGLQFSLGRVCPLTIGAYPGAERVMGIRASAVSLFSDQPGRVAVAAKVELSEVSGSDTYVHLQTELGPLVMQLAGIHKLELDLNLTVYFDPRDVYVFSAEGPLLLAPTESRGG